MARRGRIGLKAVGALIPSMAVRVLICYGAMMRGAFPGGADVLYGGAGDDRLYGVEGSDILRGGGGDDVLDGGGGADVLYAGTGVDILIGSHDEDVFVISSDLFDDSDSVAIIEDLDTTHEDRIRLDLKNWGNRAYGSYANLNLRVATGHIDAGISRTEDDASTENTAIYYTYGTSNDF